MSSSILQALYTDGPLSVLELQEQTGFRLLNLSDAVKHLASCRLLAVKDVGQQSERISLTEGGKLAVKRERF